MNRLRPLLLAVLLPLASHASSLPSGSPLLLKPQCSRIATGPGPEDMAVLPGEPARLLISSHDRRHFESTGNLYLYNTATQDMHILPRFDEPAGLQLRPHGIDLVQDAQGHNLLYVINHDDHQPNSNLHSILIYELRADGLHLRQRLQDPVLTSPDDVSVAGNGDVYVTNDRKDGESVMELALHRSRANVALYQPGKGWSIAADHLEYPNGVKAENDRVLVSLTFGSALLLYPRHADGSLGPAEQIAGKPNLDNIMPGLGPDNYLISSHLSFVDFMRHKDSSTHHSGNIVYQFNVKTRQAEPFFVDDGSLISAVSTALIADKALYLSQDFDAFIVRCPLKE